MKKLKQNAVKPAKPKIPPVLTMQDLFKKLSLTFTDYKTRNAQIELAAHIDNAVTNKSILFAEAGVGTGKTFAYLLPLIQKYFQSYPNFGPIIISTRTKNLQEQLALEDIPTITEFYKPIYKKVPDVILSKGRRNYACWSAIDRLKNTKQINNSEHKNLSYWYKGSQWGDLEEAKAPNLASAVLNKVSADNCQAFCSIDCKYRNMKDHRKITQGIIVTNHNQLISHLKMITDSEDRRLWFNPTCLVIDEAHTFEEIVRDELSNRMDFRHLFGLLTRVYSKYNHIKDALTGKKVLQDIEAEIYSQISAEESIRQKIAITKDLSDNIGFLADLLGKAAFSVDLVNSQKKNSSDADDKLFSSVEEANKSVTDFHKHLDDPNSILWIEKEKGIVLIQAPFDIGPFLAKALWQHLPFHPVILTSATLSVEAEFNGVARRLGIKDRKIMECSYPSPFDYKKNLKIFIPKDMPHPSPATDGEEVDEFTKVVAVRIKELITRSRGRALILFTSHRRMEYAYEYIHAQKLPYTLLKQGNAGPNEILRQFKKDTSSVLFATGAFWEGTDVSGEALSLLIIDKLPFPSPFDPIVARMVENAIQEESDPLQTVIVPEMLTVLKQGSGRLIRRETDTGMIALLDSRAWNPNYHEAVVKAMPPGLWIDKLG
ncbi:MAG: ATP-dependent DNA helicase [Syntrophomonas sp.]|nr:ATP-dependent DNA helicase [Syntrophomonas sp.]